MPVYQLTTASLLLLLPTYLQMVDRGDEAPNTIFRAILLGAYRFIHPQIEMFSFCFICIVKIYTKLAN